MYDVGSINPLENETKEMYIERHMYIEEHYAQTHKRIVSKDAIDSILKRADKFEEQGLFESKQKIDTKELTIDEVIIQHQLMQRACEIHGDKRGLFYSEEEYKQIVSMLEELKRYKELERQGKLLKLPCKVGDTAYVTRNYSWHKPVEIGVFPKKVTEIKMSFEEGRLKCFLSLEGQYFNFNKIGKEVFLTKEEAEKFVETQEKREPEKSLIGKRYLDKQRLPGTLKEVVDGPDSKWGQYVVKDLKTGKEHLCSGRYIMQNEVDEKSFEEWWDELDDIEKEEYNAYMSEDNEELYDEKEIEKE